MKFIVLGIFIVTVLILFLGGVLYARTEIIQTPTSVKTPTSTGAPTVAMPHPSATTTATQSVPAGFHGPTGQPHIIGPTSNPPDY